MSEAIGLNQLQVPVLTEVVAWPTPATPRESEAGPMGHLSVSAPLQEEAPLVAQILADVQQQVDEQLAHRLQEALAPVLARAAQDLVVVAHTEVTTLLHAMITQAVERELARLHIRG